MTFTWSPWEWEEVREEGGRGGDKELEKRKEGTNEGRREEGEGEERGMEIHVHAGERQRTRNILQ